MKRSKKSGAKVATSTATTFLTTNQGQRIADNHNSLKAGPRGPTLIEDFILREKITHFDHERIPERIVHARGTGARGYFECTRDMSKFTRAGFLRKVGLRTPVLVRFSTVAGSRGSADTARDPRGFAVKFYTQEGNYDLVGNNIPVFFIQDAMKFPDLVHAVKPEPHHEIPQASSAHDTFYDFISLMPESLHMMMWLMSDRAIPRSLRMMEGFGVHTFRFVNARGEASFVKFHWKPKLGTHGLVWDEATLLAGKDPDFHRRDLWEAIDTGGFPEWELGVQIVPEKDEHSFSFDLLDPTKLIPEELVPVQIVGRMVLDQNPINFFAEIEQAAFHPGHLVDGIDLSNDPLLQGRLFSYTDTQLSRLGGPNFHELPPNRPLVPIENHQRDGFGGRQQVNPGRVAYEPNSLARGCPMHAPEKLHGYVSHPERIDAHKVRARSQSFGDHVSQAQLFYRSQTPVEQQHIIDAFAFELSKVETAAIRERMLALLAHVDGTLVKTVAGKLGMATPKATTLPPNPADPNNDIVPENLATKIARADDIDKKKGRALPQQSTALSMVATNPGVATGRLVAILCTDGCRGADVVAIQKACERAGARAEVVATHLGALKTADGAKVVADKHLDSTPSLPYDAVFVPSGAAAIDALAKNGKALVFIAQAFKHLKTVGIAGEAVRLLRASPAGAVADGAPGVVVAATSSAAFTKDFVTAIALHRHWDRAGAERVPL